MRARARGMFLRDDFWFSPHESTSAFIERFFDDGRSDEREAIAGVCHTAREGGLDLAARGRADALTALRRCRPPPQLTPQSGGFAFVGVCTIPRV
jgi:hypothetical protein